MTLKSIKRKYTKIKKFYPSGKPSYSEVHLLINNLYFPIKTTPDVNAKWMRNQLAIALNKLVRTENGD